MTRLAGHTLRYEGAAFDERGVLIWAWSRGSSGEGRGKCSCGALSEVLTSGNARKAWHRWHKAEMARETR